MTLGTVTDTLEGNTISARQLPSGVITGSKLAINCPWVSERCRAARSARCKSRWRQFRTAHIETAAHHFGAHCGSGHPDGPHWRRADHPPRKSPTPPSQRRRSRGRPLQQRALPTRRSLLRRLPMRALPLRKLRWPRLPKRTSRKQPSVRRKLPTLPWTRRQDRQCNHHFGQNCGSRHPDGAHSGCRPLPGRKSLCWL